MFQNKVVVISGASSGIGAAAALEFAKEGAAVAIIGRNAEKLNRVAQECATAGSRVLQILSDITATDQPEAVIRRVVQQFGRIDVLVNNAGMMKHGSILDGKLLDAYDETMSVNVRAHLNVTVHAAPYLTKTRGNIVNVSSVAATMNPVRPSYTAYCISKAALNHFTRCAASELAEHGVRVNTVSPGPVVTDFLENAGDTTVQFQDMAPKMPLKRVSEAKEVADLILFLASDRAVGVTGSEYVVDNGTLCMGLKF